MMTELFILRHGIAVAPGTPGVADDQRPLTPKGRKRMREIALGLHRLDLKVDRIITSPLPRARSTAEIVAEVLDVTSRLEIAEALKAGALAQAVLSWLRGRSEDRLLLVGHDPTLTDLITLLVTGTLTSQVCALKKGGIAALRPLSGSTDRYVLDWLASPKLIRRWASTRSR
jgi:phosphohistidine phosphatase